MNKTHYRGEIDGLRCLAISAVVIYHFKFMVFGNLLIPGGFLGVDVFFVISGFLITQLITRDLKSSRFRFYEFYLRRFWRLVPHLIAVVFIVFPFVLWAMPLAAEREYANSALTALAFVSNIFFWMQDSYWAAGREMKPLLHTWSLGVEEQFYLIFPLLIWSCFSQKKPIYKTNFLLLILFLSIVGYLISFNMDYGSFEFAFYMLPARFWEFSIGIIAANLGADILRDSKLTRFGLNVVGIGLILVPMFMADKTTLHPYLAALCVCVGTAILLTNCHGDDPIAKMLTVKPVVFIGLISYALYLWHWPVFVVGKAWMGDAAIKGTQASLVMVAVSLGLSVVGYTLIERPMRTAKYKFRSAVVLLCLAVPTATASVSIANNWDYELRYGRQAKKLRTAVPTSYEAFCGFTGEAGFHAELGCPIGDQSQQRVSYVLFGDSHAMAVSELFDKLGKDSGRRGLFIAASGCPPIFDLYPLRGQPLTKNCYEINQHVRSLLKTGTLKHLFLVARWNYYTDRGALQPVWDSPAPDNYEFDHSQTILEDAFRKTIKEINDYRAIPVVQLQAPHQLIDPKDFFTMERDSTIGELRNYILSAEEHVARQALAKSLIDRTIKNQRVILVDPAQFMCDEICMISNGNLSLYSDNDHVTTAGATLFSAPYRKLFSQ